MDQYFNEFLYGEEFSPMIEKVAADDQAFNNFRGKAPDRLLNYWREYGFSGFSDGLFWIVNPNDYRDIIANLLKKTSLWGKDNFYTVARTAFGELYVFGENSDSYTIINPHLNNIIPGDMKSYPPEKDVLEKNMGSFFMFLNKETLEYDDAKGNGLFKRCLKKHGLLSHDEMYTFSPALALGGSADIENIKKVKIIEELSILCDLDTPVVLPSANELFGGI